MKKFITILITLFVILFIVTLVTPAIFGYLTKKGLEDYVKTEGLEDTIDMSTYKSGWFSSRLVTDFSDPDAEDESATPLSMVNEIKHGPIAWGAGLKPCMAFVTTTLDRSKMTEGNKQILEEIYDGEEPVVIKTLSKFNGNYVSKVILNRADGESEGTKVRFEGGDGEFTYDEDMTFIKGRMTVTPISVKNDEEDMSFSMGAIDLNDVDYQQGKKMIANATMGEMRFNFLDESGEEITLKAKGGEMKSDFKAHSPDSSILVGSATGSIRQIEMASALFGFNVDTLNFKQIFEVAGKSMNASVAYSFDGFEPVGEETAMPLPEIEGLEFKAGISNLSLTTAEAMFDLYNASKINLSEEAANEQSAEAVKIFINGLKEGTAIDINLGSTSTDDLKLSINFGYAGSGNITSIKTIGKVLETLAANIDIALPAEMINSNPMFAAMLQPQIEGGMVVADEKSYRLKAELAKSNMILNGQPTPLIEAMLGPMLEQKMDWDAFFKSVEEGMKSDGSELADEESPVF